ncbi:hypothetical protein HMPREF2987_00300 [Streptococcus sp. HMSC067H01]|nr:hypothetical protein HMPREF2987_00300 [Streptococcus sp. HMSC067H01]
MHSCPKKTSEAMFDWMATTALKTFFERITILTKSTFRGVLFLLISCRFVIRNLLEGYRVNEKFGDHILFLRALV